MRTPLFLNAVRERRTMTHSETPDLLKFAKSRAKKLRAYLLSQEIKISHSQCLEATAQAEGFKDWNTYAARFRLAAEALAEETSMVPDSRFPLVVGDRVSGLYRGAAFEGTLLGLELTKKPGVWRIKMRFDAPVALPSHPDLKLTRQQVRLLVNDAGHSVNLVGKPDGETSLTL